MNAEHFIRFGYATIQNVFDPALIKSVIDQQINIMRGSMPNYHALEFGVQNFFRVNFDDERSYVKTKSVQFNYFPWNQDFLSIFKAFEGLFEIRDQANMLISKHAIKSDKFGSKYIIPRISIQFYPGGGGYMMPHRDPVGSHQIAIANVVCSKYGSAYSSGGLFLEDPIIGKRVYVESEANIGDVIVFRGDLIHGVAPIDPSMQFNPLTGKGRWMIMSGITRSAINNEIKNAEQIDG